MDAARALQLLKSVGRYARNEGVQHLVAFLDRALAEKLLEDPHKPTAELLREAGLVKSARAVEARNAPPPDGLSSRRTTAPAQRTKGS